jgi:hypothetical protein
MPLKELHTIKSQVNMHEKAYNLLKFLKVHWAYFVLECEILQKENIIKTDFIKQIIDSAIAESRVREIVETIPTTKKPITPSELEETCEEIIKKYEKDKGRAFNSIAATFMAHLNNNIGVPIESTKIFLLNSLSDPELFNKRLNNLFEQYIEKAKKSKIKEEEIKRVIGNIQVLAKYLLQLHPEIKKMKQIH